jgi:RNA methyltransferase, TrmH family
MSKPLTSAQNPKIKQLVRLKERRERDATGLFLIEGYREIERAVKGGIQFEALFICKELFLGSNEPKLIEDVGAELFSLPGHLFEKISYRDRPDGLMAIAHQMRGALSDLPIEKTPLYVVAEAIEKPGNLGTILRSADGVGASGVIVCDRCTDIYNPNVVRASVGTLFTLPVIEASGVETLKWLKERGVLIAAAAPSAELDYTVADLKGPLAIAVGTEQLGLSDIWMQASDIRVKIPMCGVADSLNVAMATTLLVYEAYRQRHSLPR